MDLEEWASNKQIITDYYNRVWPNSKYISKNDLGIHYGYYDKDHKNHQDAILNMNNQVALGLKLENDLTYSVLDAGCGVGGTIIYLAKKFPNITFTGINISDEQIKLAYSFSEKKGIKDRVNFLNRDYLDTNFPDGTFDGVYALESMCYAFDKHIFVKEVNRILKPGGRLVVLDGFRNGEYLINPSLEKRYDSWCKGWALEYKLDTQINFKRYLEEENFQDILYRDITSNVLPSSKEIYKLWVKYLIKLYFLRILSGNNYSHIHKAGIYQKKLLKSRYLIYGAFSAQKPP